MDGLFLKYLLCRRVGFWSDRLFAFHIFQHCISRFSIGELVTSHEMDRFGLLVVFQSLIARVPKTFVIGSKIENVLAVFYCC